VLLFAVGDPVIIALHHAFIIFRMASRPAIGGDRPTYNTTSSAKWLMS